MYSSLKTIIIVIFIWICLPIHLSCQSRDPEQAKNAKLMDLVRKMDSNINFYGQVVDEQGNPIKGAEINIDLRRFDPINIMGVFSSSVSINLRSDAKGFFFIRNERGSTVYVNKIKKVGYEHTIAQQEKETDTFHYDKELNKPFTPDPNNPVVYRLRKKGAETFLTKGGGGFTFTAEESGAYKGYDFFREGPGFPIKAEDLAHPKVYGIPVVCDLRAQATLDLRTGTWTVVLAPGNPGGGIQASNELLYEAPAMGYQPSLTFKVQSRGPKDPQRWETIKTPTPTQYLYLRSRMASIYSRIHLGETCEVRWKPSGKDPNTFVQELVISASATINPYGDRILEEATDLPGDVWNRLHDEMRASYSRGERPSAPDLAKLVQEWEKNRPFIEKLKGRFR